MLNFWKMTSLAALASFSFATVGSSSTVTEVAGIVEDVGAADRIEYGDRLRTLSQSLASAACHLKAGVDVGPSKKILKSGIKEFDHLSQALRFGNEDLHIIGEEKDPKTRRAMDRLNKEWAPMKDAYTAVLANEGNTAALEAVYAGNDGLLKWTDILVTQLEAEYSNPTELLQSDVLLIEVAGKQAMATQRLSYEACKIWTGVQTDDEVAELKELVDQFQFAVSALKDGRPELGLLKAPTDKIEAKLESVISDWEEISWKLNALADSGSITHDEAQKMCRVLYKKMASMEKVTHLYVEYSRRVY